MTGERCALVFCAIATLFSFIALIAVRNNTLTVDLKVSELSKMVSELEASNQLLANDLALLISIPPGTTTIEVLCQQMESSQTNISALYQQVGQLQAGMADLDDRVASLDGGAGAGGGSIFPAGWLNDFMSVEVDENNDASLVITAPAISFRTPQAKTITQQIQGQNNWHWSSDTIDCHVGDTITWDWSTNENIIEADSTFNPLSNPSFSSGALNLGGSYSHVFKASGTHYYMSQNTASLSGTVVVYPGNVQAHSGLLQVPTSGSGAAFRPACAFDTVGTLYMERNMISVCMEFSVHDFAQPGFGQLRYAFAPMAGFETTSIYGGYEYATMDGCPENPDTDSPCQTATQYGSENAIALPSGWSIATWSSSSSSYAYQYFHGNWGAYSLVANIPQALTCGVSAVVPLGLALLLIATTTIAIILLLALAFGSHIQAASTTSRRAHPSRTQAPPMEDPDPPSSWLTDSSTLCCHTRPGSIRDPVPGNPAGLCMGPVPGAK
eukprot:CAMPEP_0185755924 /NCGR_PEP_ID=MMETSP1174-20130828/14387_1 /TAXON_ID=35687 /ORGANISM="Dictyocha speculum, Strain CCMP1381" /LENGTH=496 /DNA_ID=CAMNT_0028434681 /DNA_START=466 /DNA_END=1958 /DNA_ORIENTATION=+